MFFEWEWELTSNISFLVWKKNNLSAIVYSHSETIEDKLHLYLGSGGGSKRQNDMSGSIKSE